MTRFESSLDHLLAEVKRIDLTLYREVVRRRSQRREAKWDEFRGLYISEDEIDDLMSSGFEAVPSIMSEPSEEEPIDRIDERLRELETEIGHQRQNSLSSGIELRLEHVKQLFGLMPLELDSLLVGLLPELDLNYQKLFAYLQDDVTKKAPSVDLILRLLARSAEDRRLLRSAFMPQGRLLSCQIVSLQNGRSAEAASLLERTVGVEERVVHYLLDSDEIDKRLVPFVRLVKPQAELSQVLLPPDIKERLHNLMQGEVQSRGVVFCLQGEYGAGKRMTAEAMCRELGMPLLIVDTAHMLAGDLPADLALQLVAREASLQKSCVYWDRYDVVLDDERNLEAHRQSILEWVRQRPGVVFLSSRVAWEPGGGAIDKPFVKIEMPVPPFSVRKQLWQTLLDDHMSVAPDVDLDVLANKFRLTGGQIRDAVAGARDLAAGWGNGRQQISMDDLHCACRAQSNQKLSSVARKISPKFTWEDIVLPNDQMTQLREMTNQVRYKHVVYGDWNFEKKLSLGLGLNVLFAGPSGTGKTMAAEIIGGELGLDLYKIDLSTVVSKYIGETEKNLDKIFKEAQNSNAILFFDEADAIFGKRSEVRDSHDRYANIEIAYLLQKMEEYDGIVILATNLRKNLDEAFARRMHFSVEFPSPEEPDRYRIWQRVFPKEAPTSGDVDLSFMARQFKITGGNIKNIALGAAFLAASDGRTITIEHLIRATKREYQKIGRLCTETDFGIYFDLVKS
jgi:ATP-dependent 26S proteasome regulatory subunit